MRGNGYRNVVGENIAAVTPMLREEKRFGSKPKTCWSCQKDKPTKDGHIKTWAGGHMKFVCKDCLDAKAAAKGESK